MKVKIKIDNKKLEEFKSRKRDVRALSKDDEYFYQPVSLNSCASPRRK